MPAGRPKKIDAPTENEPAFGVTGYGVTLEHEGQTIEGNFITDEDLKEYQDYKAKFDTHVFVEKGELQRLDKEIEALQSGINNGKLLTNDEAAHYSSLKDNAAIEAAKMEAEQAKSVKAEEKAKEAAAMKLGPNPVHASNVDGVRNTVFPRNAWDNLNWEMKDGEETKVKSGGWFVKADMPDEISQMLSNA